MLYVNLRKTHLSLIQEKFAYAGSVFNPCFWLFSSHISLMTCFSLHSWSANFYFCLESTGNKLRFEVMTNKLTCTLHLTNIAGTFSTHYMLWIKKLTSSSYTYIPRFSIVSQSIFCWSWASKQQHMMRCMHFSMRFKSSC